MKHRYQLMKKNNSTVMSICCNSKLIKNFKNEKIETLRCSCCSTIWANHGKNEVQIGEKPWALDSVTPKFINALDYRRKIQAKLIFKKFSNILKQGSCLDYGCGRGEFLKYLRSNDVNAFGCDIQVSDENLLQNNWACEVEKPWEIPKNKSDSEISTLILLDVIEHMPDPSEFLARAKDIGVKYIIIKTPNFFGPIASGANILSKTGYTAMMEKLLLTGDHSPHVSFFTKRGLIKLLESNGFTALSSLNMAEVGKELSNRVRSTDKSRNISSSALLIVGIFLDFISRTWSDTTCMLFEIKT